MSEQVIGRDARHPATIDKPLPAPTGLTATPLPGSPTEQPAIMLVWTDNAKDPDVTVRLQRAADAGFAAGLVELAQLSGTTTYTDAPVLAGHTQHYRIRAEGPTGCSAWSSTASARTLLPAPIGLLASVAGNGPLRIDLSWTNRSYATGVHLQRATNPTFTAGLVTVALPVGTSWVDDTVAADTTYYHRVRTHYLGSASAWSNVATVTTPHAPAAPVGLRGWAVSEPGGATVVTVSWSKDAGSVVTGWTLQRAADREFRTGLVTVAVPGPRRAVSDTVAPDSTYHYRLRAANPAGISVFSEPIVVRTA
ncbi:fibronectin type III domain-containing protein [Plantactinospora sp. KBS50]|uniref:fibronectin type III domain-containing protein n=1 Tax=Plantactinospora sp. KBS50 TaxID=2024580 RepID=UPI000BAAF681|nr:fibronectin type III domain-containing protein [Plantactinospora sp. KBS50]ASW56985.1 hypothetical protein CIK06_26745 [Plantactinospora sp. KBS50]